MKLQAVDFTAENLKEFLENEENKGKILLLQDITTKSISCSRCNASGNNSNDIKHKSCCPYIGGDGCRGGSK